MKVLFADPQSDAPINTTELAQRVIHRVAQTLADHHYSMAEINQVFGSLPLHFVNGTLVVKVEFVDLPVLGVGKSNPCINH